jgi:hypothetical protein
MKTIVKGSVLAALVALLALAAPPALAQAGDDYAGFYVAEPLQVGAATLSPGYYLIRSVRMPTSHNVLVVSDLEQTKVFTTLLATPHQLASDKVTTVSKLVYDAGDVSRPNTLRTWFVANKSLGFDIMARTAPTQVASVKQAEIIALATAR